MKRAVLYLRVSTTEQTTANQERELREIASRMGCEIVKVYKDHGISGAKGRDKRPAFDALCRDAAKRQFDMVMAWSVDRLGRSLQDLVAFLSELHALRIDLFLHQQGLDTAVARSRLGLGSIRAPCSGSAALSSAQASRSHNGQEARRPATQVGYRLCLFIEVKQTAMLRCGNRCF
jgi:DNA invertase Pin-like site-specific DNA recombinase